MVKRPLIFVGSRWVMSQLAVVADLLGYEIVGILDHHFYGNTEEISQIPVIGDERSLLDPDNKQARSWLNDCEFFPANWWTGNQPTNDSLDLQHLRIQRINILEKSGARVANLIHPGSMSLGSNSKYSSISLGKGIFVDDDCWICAYDVTLGDYCTIMMGSRIANGSHFGKNVCTGPGIYSFHVDVGDNSYLGGFCRTFIYDSAIPKTYSVGSNCTIWSRAELDRNMPDGHYFTHNGRLMSKQKVLSEDQLRIGG